MKNGKKFLSLLLSLLLCLSLVPGAAAMEADEPVAEQIGDVERIPAEEPERITTPEKPAAPPAPAAPQGTIVDSGSCGENLSWALDDAGLLTVSGTGEMTDHPWSISHQSKILQVVIERGVTSIVEYAFCDCSSLLSVSIPSTVTLIGNNAFNSCSVLASVSIPDGVTVIENGAFYRCTSLAVLDLSDSVSFIGEYAFAYCSFSDLVLPGSVNSIKDHAFYCCSMLDTVTIPDSIREMGIGAFSGCDKITRVNISDLAAWLSIQVGDRESLPHGPLYLNEKLLREVNIPQGVTQIPEAAFWGCNSLVSVIIPEGVTSIGAYAFYCCSRLTDLIVPQSVETIGAWAFSGCSGLTQILLPERLSRIEDYTFHNCSQLTSITLPASLTSIGSHAFYCCSSLSSIDLPETLQSIGSCAFYCCSSLSSIDLPEALRSIGDYSFYCCVNLAKVTIPSGINMIAEGSFSCCYGLSQLILSEGLRIISFHAFNCCNQLSEITLPSSINAIGKEAFISCSNINFIRFLGDAPGFGDGVFSSVTATAYYPDDRAWESYDLYNYGGNLTWEPFILVSLQGSPEDQVLLSGEVASFSQPARGEDLSRQWYRQLPGQDWVLIPDAVGETLSIPASADLDCSLYRCEVSDRWLRLNGESAELRILKSPVIEQQPEDVSVLAGQTAHLSLQAIGEDLTYQWYYQIPGTDTWKAVSADSGKTSDYTFIPRAKHNGYRYYCVVSNRAGSVTSDIVTLSYNAKPIITIQPVDQSVRIGEQANFSVTASGESLSYQWYYQIPGAENWKAVSAASGKTSSYSFTPQTRHEGYQYRCKVSNSAGSVLSDTVTLHVDAAPYFTAQPSDLTVKKGERADFQVKAAGENLSYQWYYLAPDAGSWKAVSASSGKTAHFIISSTQARHNGYRYRCEVSNAYGSVTSEDVLLTVKLPANILQQPQSVSAAVGQDAIFHTKAEGEELVYRWQMKLPGDGAWIDCTETYAGGKILLVEVTADLNGVLFRCEIGSSGGVVYTDVVSLSVS